MIDKLPKALRGIARTLYVNARDLVAVSVSCVLLYLFLGWVEALNEPSVVNGELVPSKWGFLFEFVAFVKGIVAFVLIITLPWLMVAVTTPNTYGKFVNSGFDLGWKCLGAAKMGQTTFDASRSLLGLSGMHYGEALAAEAKFVSCMHIYFMFMAVESVALLAVLL